MSLQLLRVGSMAKQDETDRWPLNLVSSITYASTTKIVQIMTGVVGWCGGAG